MPIPALRAVARQTGASLRTVESKWRKAKPKVKPVEQRTLFERLEAEES